MKMETESVNNKPHVFTYKLIRILTNTIDDNMCELLSRLPDVTRVSENSVRYVIRRKESLHPDLQVRVAAVIRLDDENNMVEIDIISRDTLTNKRVNLLRHHINEYLRWCNVI